MTTFTYPKGLIPMTGGFVKNNPSDTYPMGISKDLYGGFKVELNVADMLSIHPNYLISGYTACLVLEGESGTVELYYLSKTPTNTDSTVIEDWVESKIGPNSEEGLVYKGKFDPLGYTIKDEDEDNSPGDLYIVSIEDTVTEVDVLDPLIFKGARTTVKTGDWIIFNGGAFEHIDQQQNSIQSWETITNKPKVLTDLVNGIIPSHTHSAGSISVNTTVGQTNYIYLDELLSIIVYSNTIASSAGSAESNQLLTLEQLEERFVSSDLLSTTVSDLVTAQLGSYFTKAEVNSLLESKQPNLSDPDIKDMLLNNPDTNTLTDAELLSIQNIAETKPGAKIVLHSVEALDSGLINTTTHSEIVGESYVTEFTSTGSMVRCTFRFTTMASLYGAFTVNELSFDSVTRVGTSEIFEGVLDLDITALNELTIEGDADLVIPILTADTMIDAASIGLVTLPKTHFYNGENIPINVILDDDVTHIEIINGDGIINQAKFAVNPISNMTTIQVVSNHTGNIKTGACDIIPYKGNVIGKNFLLSSIPLDDTTPSISADLVYLNGYNAIKDAEEVDINITGSNYDELTVDAFNSGELTIVSTATDKVKVSRSGGHDVTSIVSLQAKKATNQKTSSINASVIIYNGYPTVLVTTQNIKSGQNEVLELVDNPSKVYSVSDVVPEKGTAYANNTTIIFNADDTVAHDGSVINITYNYITIAGKTGSGNASVKLTGFAERTIELAYPLFSVVLPFDLSGNPIVMSATIQSSPPFEITSFVENGTDVNGYTITDNNTINLKTELEAFGYNENNSIVVKISE